MDLHDAFKAAVRKYYQGFELSATKKVHGKFDYGFKELDAIHENYRKKPTTPVQDVSQEAEQEIAASNSTAEEGLE